MRGLIQEMEGGDLDLQMPPTARRSRSEAATRERRGVRERGDSAPPQLGGRETPEDQTPAIVA